MKNSMKLHLGYIWFLENTKKGKKILKKIIFLCMIVLWRISKKIRYN